MAHQLQVQTTYRQIFKIAGPISFALLVPQANFVINNIFLGQLSEEALAVASITGVYYLIFAGIGYGLNNGLQSLLSRRAGENNPTEMGRIFSQGIFIALGIAAIGILITYTITPFILLRVLHTATVAEEAISFLRIRIWGLLFLYLYQMRNALLVSLNLSRFLVLGTLAEALANVLFDYGLIFGKLSMPQLGFNGAAVASVIAEAIGLIAIYAVIRWRKLDSSLNLFASFKTDGQRIRQILHVSGPLIFQHAISIISWLLFYILIERNTSQTGLAVSNTMRTIFGFLGVFVWALASTTNSMVSNIIGQGKQREVFPLVYKIIRINLTLAFIVFVGLNLLAPFYLNLFGHSTQFVETGIPVVRVVSVAVVGMAISVIWLNAVIGTGNTKASFVIEAISITVYSFYVLAVMEWTHGKLWIGWLSEWVYWLVMGSLAYAYMRWGPWRQKFI